MPQVKAKQEEGSLTDFAFDDEESFFGIAKAKDKSPLDEDEDEDDDKVTKIDEPSKNGKAKQKVAAQVEDDEDVEFTFGAEPNPPNPKTDKDDEAEKDKSKEKAKVVAPVKKSTKVEDDEDEDDIEDEKVVTDKAKKTGNKGEEAKDKDEDSVEQTDEEFFTGLVDELKEKGIFQNIKVKKDEVITEERFFELQDEELEARLEETFESFFENMDEDAKRFLKFKKDGGRSADFLAVYTSGLKMDEFDEANDTQRLVVLRYYLANVEKMDAEEVEDRLAWLKEGGKEKAYATKYYAAIKKEETRVKDALVKDQAERATDKEVEVKEFNAGIKEVLDKVESVGAFPITKTEQRELGAYITKPTAKVGKNRYVPQFQADIAKIFRAEKDVDKKKLILLAKLVRSNFDVKDIVTEVKTKTATAVKSTLRQTRGLRPTSSGSYSNKGLADYFNAKE